MDDLVKYYGMRPPYEGEDKFFSGRPEVGGIAAEDGKIVLNPYSKLKENEKMSVARNEAIRLFMRKNNIYPNFDVTKSQSDFFKGTEYEKDNKAMMQSIIARILTNDPSAHDATLEQVLYAQRVADMISKMKR